MEIRGGRVRRFPVAAVLGVCGLLTACGRTGEAVRSAPSPDRVNIGYATRDARDVTGAVGSVTEHAIGESDGMQLVDILATRVPGVQVYRRPDGDLSVRIRGAARSMRGEPLVVVDGMPVHSGRLMSVFNSVPSRRVARVDVLKDAGSTAAFGVRGANGVILITTKR